MSEAIHKDVSKRSRRDEAMDAIVSQVYDAPIVPNEEKQEVQELPDKQEEEVKETLKVEETAKSDDDQFVTLKVDGREEKFERDKVLEAGKRALQKESTADKRLEEAARRRKELEELQGQLEAQREELYKKRQGLDHGKEFVSSMYDDEDKAASVINELAKELQQTKQAVANMARQQQIQAEEEQQKVVDYYFTNYDDISKDEDMHIALSRRADRIQKENPSLTPFEIVDRAATEVYQKFGVVKEQSVKEKMPRQVNKASVRTPAKPEAKPQSTADIINEMRGIRGRQPVPIR